MGSSTLAIAAAMPSHPARGMATLNQPIIARYVRRRAESSSAKRKNSAMSSDTTTPTMQPTTTVNSCSGSRIGTHELPDGVYPTSHTSARHRLSRPRAHVSDPVPWRTVHGAWNESGAHSANPLLPHSSSTTSDALETITREKYCG